MASWAKPEFRLHTSRSQVHRLLDPRHTTVSLLTVARAATVLGKRVVISIADQKPATVARRKK